MDPAAGIAWYKRLLPWLREARNLVSKVGGHEARLSAIEAEVAELRATLSPYRDTFDFDGVCWAWSSAESKNIPYCPLCRANGGLVPLHNCGQYYDGLPDVLYVCNGDHGENLLSAE